MVSTRVALSSVALGAALLLTLSACSGSDFASRVPAPVEATPTATVEPVAEPVSPPPAPVPTPTPVDTTKLDLIVTLYGSDATFTWTTGGTSMHQTTGQTGPFSYTLPYNTDQTVIANVIAMNGDAGCKVTRGDFVVVDNTAPGQSAVSCTKF